MRKIDKIGNLGNIFANKKYSSNLKNKI